jgi:predicted nucleic acid-binding protein
MLPDQFESELSIRGIILLAAGREGFAELGQHGPPGAVTRKFSVSSKSLFIKDALPPSVLTQVESWITEGAVISVLSRIEVLGYPQTADQLQQAMRLLAYFEEIPLHESVVQWTITLRQQYRIRLPDALSAATALDRGFPLVTRNTQDFHTINCSNPRI